MTTSTWSVTSKCCWLHGKRWPTSGPAPSITLDLLLDGEPPGERGLPPNRPSSERAVFVPKGSAWRVRVWCGGEEEEEEADLWTGEATAEPWPSLPVW